MLAAQQPCDQSGNSCPLAHGTKHRPRGSWSPPKLAMTSTRSQQPLSSSLTTASQQIQKPARTLKRNHGTVLGSFLCQALVRIGVPSGDTSPVCRHGPCKILHSLLRCQANHTALCKQHAGSHVMLAWYSCIATMQLRRHASNHANKTCNKACRPTCKTCKQKHHMHGLCKIMQVYAIMQLVASMHASRTCQSMPLNMQSCNCKQHPINPKP